MVTAVLVILIIAALVAVMKYAKFMWRIVGVLAAVFLIWLYKEDIVTWFSTKVAGQGLLEFLNNLTSTIKSVLDKILYGLGDLI